MRILFLMAAALLQILAGQVQAQNYPLSAGISISSPYSLRLSDYASIPSKFQIQLINKDFATPVVDVYLKLLIEGPGITLSTSAGYRHAPLTVTAGLPLQTDGTSIPGLFSLSNLDVQGMDKSELLGRGSLLPEGIYRISVVAYDYYRGLRVSNAGAATLAAFLHPPPLLSLPADGDAVPAADPQFMLLQWTPRHVLSPSASGKIRYKLRIVEMLPGSHDPNDVMQSSSVPFFEFYTEATAYTYVPENPLLVPGRRYAWQVQAIDADGLNAFENDGYSQVFSFVYGSKCSAPQNLRKESSPPGLLQLGWDTVNAARSYVLYYRRNNSFAWESEMVFSSGFQLSRLQPSARYEFQVSAVCQHTESERSEPLYLKTDSAESPYRNWASRQCGKKLPSVDLSNRNPLGSLNAGDSFRAADFLVRVISAEGKNGVFSGVGAVFLPFTGKIPIPCRFENVQINSDKRLIGGSVILAEKPMVIGDQSYRRIAAQWNDWFGSNWNQIRTMSYPGKLLSVVVHPGNPGELQLEGSTGSVRLPAGRNTVITDGSGSRWYVSSKGVVTLEEGPAEPPLVSDPQRQDGAPRSIRPGVGKVFFCRHEDAEMAWDSELDRAATAGTEYEQLTSDTAYPVAWQLLQTGRSCKVRAMFSKGAVADVHPDSIRFVRSDGTRVPHVRNGNWYEITVNGRLHLQSDALWAVADIALQSGAKKNREVLGKLSLVSVDQRVLSIRLMPVNGMGTNCDTAKLAGELRRILKPMALDFRLQLEPELSVPDYDPQTDAIPVNRNALAGSYSAALWRFVQHLELRGKSDPASAYLFLLGKSDNPENDGYMALSRNYGFLFLGSAQTPSAHTLAHEIGHGLLCLDHVFGSDLSRSGVSRNLMDYSAPFAFSNFSQWKTIHDPKYLQQAISTSWQSSIRGKMVNANRHSLAHYGIPATGNLHFVAPDGRILRFRADSLTDLSFSYEFVVSGSVFLTPVSGNARGPLTSFTYGGTTWKAQVYKNKFIRYITENSTNTSITDQVFYVSAFPVNVYTGTENNRCELLVQEGILPASIRSDTLIRTVALSNARLLKTLDLQWECEEYLEPDRLSRHAQQWWKEAQINSAFASTEAVIRRITRLINRFDEDFRYYDHRSYKALILSGKIKPDLYFCDPLKPFTAASLSAYENYLRAGLLFRDESERTVLQVSDPAKMAQLLAFAPPQFYQSLTLRLRLHILQVLCKTNLRSSEWFGQTLAGGGSEGIAVKVLTETPEQDRRAVLDSLTDIRYGSADYVHLLHALNRDYYGVDGDNFALLANTLIGWIQAEYQAHPDVLGLIGQDRFIAFRSGFWTGDAVRECFTPEGRVQLKNLSPSARYARVTAGPYEPVVLYLSEETELFGARLPARTQLQVPAYLVYVLFNNENTANLYKGGKLAFDVALFAVGVGELKAALTTVRSVGSVLRAVKAGADLAFAGGDILVNDVLLEELQHSPGGAQFLDDWNRLQLIWGVSSLSYEFGLLSKKVLSAKSQLYSGASDELKTKLDEVERLVKEAAESGKNWVTKRTDFWNDWISKCFPSRDWNKTSFQTLGKDYLEFKSGQPLIDNEMRSMYNSPIDADNFLPGIINSGRTYPMRITADQGEKFYKIVPKGNNINSPSPYYLGETEYQWLKTNPSQIEQKLGLPLSSVSAEYDVFTITSKKDDNPLFQSEIASTKQFAIETPDIVYATSGGIKQTLIINNNKSNLWDKSKFPIETISPSVLPQ